MPSVVRQRLILFPGMACDERLFSPQRRHGLQFESPRLPLPTDGEDLPSYADRVVRELDLGDAPCVLGGASFGGMLACEVASRCDCQHVILIGSCRSSAAIPGWNWALFWFAKLLPDAVIRRLAKPTTRLMARTERIGPEHRQRVLAMCQDMPIDLIRRQAAMILGWRNPSRVDCAVHQIHGGHDHMIPLARVQADEVIPDGGHFINLTHPAEVTRFISRYAE